MATNCHKKLTDDTGKPFASPPSATAHQKTQEDASMEEAAAAVSEDSFPLLDKGALAGDDDMGVEALPNISFAESLLSATPDSGCFCEDENMMLTIAWRISLMKVRLVSGLRIT